MEKQISNNYFVIRDVEKAKSYLLQSYPFKLFRLNEITKNAIINHEINVDDLVNDESNTDIFTSPGRLYMPIIIMTNKCNLKCKYCYADAGNYGFPEGQVIKNEYLDKTVDYIFRTVERNKADLSGKNLEIAFVAFGGESLINLDGIIHLLNYAISCAHSINLENDFNVKPIVIINTNGVLMTEDCLLRLLEYEDNIEFVISFDGKYHDENRIDYNNEGSEHRVIKAINLLNKYKQKYYVTCCLIPSHLGEIAENIRYIRSIVGPGVQINLSFIRGAIESVKNYVTYPGMLQQSYSEKDVEQFAKDIVNLIDFGENIYGDKFYNRMVAGGFRNKCAACTFEFCVSCDGSVYPCHNFIQPSYKLGHIMDENLDITKTPIYEKFVNRTVDSFEECSKCYLKTICISSFDCAAHSEHDLGDFNVTDRMMCKVGKKIQSALLLRSIRRFEDGISENR